MTTVIQAVHPSSEQATLSKAARLAVLHRLKCGGFLDGRSHREIARSLHVHPATIARDMKLLLEVERAITTMLADLTLAKETSIVGGNG